MALPDPKTLPNILGADFREIEKRILSDPSLLKDFQSFHNLLPLNPQLNSLRYMQNNAYPKGSYNPQEREHIRRVLFENIDYIDPHALPNAYDKLFAVSFIDAFLWGPNGEWLGYVKSKDMQRDFERSPSGRYARSCRFILEVIEPDGNLLPLDSQTMSRYGYYNSVGTHLQIPIFARFEDYNVLHEWRRTFEYGHESCPHSLEVAGLFQNLCVNQEAYRQWTDAMKSNRYAFGYGCLRDSEDKFDPLGVLADINGVEWIWDESEGAYRVEMGDAYSLPASLFREMLSVSTQVPNPRVEKFLNLFPKLMDRCTSFEQVAQSMADVWNIIEGRTAGAREVANLKMGEVARVGDTYNPMRTELRGRFFDFSDDMR